MKVNVRTHQPRDVIPEDVDPHRGGRGAMVHKNEMLARGKEHLPPHAVYGCRSPLHVHDVTEDLRPLDHRVERSGAALGRSDIATGKSTID
jgi:hypothetical protein